MYFTSDVGIGDLCAGDVVVSAGRKKSGWRKFLTPEEAEEISTSDDMLQQSKALYAAWKKKHARRHYIIQNRACQRARYAVSHKQQ